MYLKGKSVPLRRRGPRLNPGRIIFWLFLAVAILIYMGLINYKVIDPPLVPTAQPTRTALSYAEEARAQFAAGKFEKAVEAYDGALALEPKNVDYHVGKARAFIFADKDAEALEAAEKALLAAPDSAKAKAIYAWALYWNNQTDEAQAAAVQAVTLDQNYAPAHAYYSFVLNDSSLWDQGLREARQALQLDPTLIEAHWAMGFSNEAVGNYEGAITHYNNALQINPNVISLYLQAGVNYRTLGDRAAAEGLGRQSDLYFEQAIAYINKAIAVDPNNVGPYLSLGRTYIKIDQLGAAQQAYDRALEIEPNNPTIHGRLGLLLFKRQNYEGAEAPLRLAIFGGTYEIEMTNGLTETVQVGGLPLTLDSLEFYYTFANVQTFNYKCGAAPDEAPAMLRQVLNFAPDDPVVQNVYSAGMEDCRIYNSWTPTPGPAEQTATALAVDPFATPTITPTRTPRPTQKP
jgi:tetratricopeptide (TPR) repeat protein